MRLAIIGAGNVGGTLGTAWAQKAGHEIFFGVRNPTSDQTQAVVRRLEGRARAGTPAQAAAFAEFIVLTTPWNAAEAAIRSMGDLKGKILLDATNPVAIGPDGLSLEIGHNISAGQKVQAWATGASVFKTLNTTGFGNMAEPVFHGMKSVMFVAGDNACLALSIDRNKCRTTNSCTSGAHSRAKIKLDRHCRSRCRSNLHDCRAVQTLIGERSEADHSFCRCRRRNSVLVVEKR